MKKIILMLIAITTLPLSAMDEKAVKEYFKDFMKNKKHFIVKDINTISTYKIEDSDGWEVYFFSLRSANNSSFKQIVFTKENKVQFSLKDKDGRAYEKMLKPKVPKEAYNDEHLLVGNANAKHKLLVFSDPFCPKCKKYVTLLIDMVKKNSDTFALYYYHYPLLKIHPASFVVARAMHIFQQKSDIENFKKMYNLSVNKRERAIGVILADIKAKTGVDIKVEEIISNEMDEAIKYDIAMKNRLMITRTPTVFFDDMWDYKIEKYKKYIK